MKLTRYGQSCVLVENNGERILIDPGSFFSSVHPLSEIGKLSAVFYTHMHGDHFDPELIEELQTAGVAMHGPSDITEHHPQVQAVEPGDELKIGPVKVRVVDLPHCSLRSTPRPYNLGYVIDETLLHPGDSSDSSGVQVPVLAVPILGPDISPKDGIDQIMATGAKLAIPIHFDMFAANPATFANFCKFMGAETIEIRILGDGQSTEF